MAFHPTEAWHHSGGWQSSSPHPVSCRCPAPADYCTPAPGSDVPEGRGRNVFFWKMKQNTTHSDSHEAIFSGLASEAADALRYSRRISIFTWLRMRRAVEIHRAACQSDSWQICVFWFRPDQRFEGWYQHTSTDLKLVTGDISAHNRHLYI